MDVQMSTRAAENRTIRKAFRHHSRTFSLAARLLPRHVQLPIATLYLFCRAIDTIADRRVLDVGPAQARAELETARRKLDATLTGHPPAEMLWHRLAEVHTAYGILSGPLYELIDGAAWDLAGRGIDDRQDLLDYSNLVGGSVGVMMLPFLADRGTVAALEAPARSLGIAMQITNILRDVGEDRRQLGRLYLPRTWLAAHGLTGCDLDAGSVTDAYPALLERAMETAEACYSEGFAGIAALPGRMQMGIRGAARMYREIMNEVRANGYDNLTRRAYVPLGRKLRVVAQDDYARRKSVLLDRVAYVA